MIGDNKPDPPPQLSDSWLFEARDAGLTWHTSRRLRYPGGKRVYAYLSRDGDKVALALSTGLHTDRIEVFISEKIGHPFMAGEPVPGAVVALGTASELVAVPA